MNASFYLTPASISYLIQSVLALAITGYFLFRIKSASHPHFRVLTNLLAGFFVSIALFSLLLFMEASLPRGKDFYAIFPQTAVLAIGLVSLLQFAYRFPSLPSHYKKEAQWVFVLSVLYALYEILFMFYRYSLLNAGQVIFRPRYADYPQATFLLWVLVIFLRQSLHSSSNAHQSQPTSVFSLLKNPQGKDARVTRLLALVYLIPFGLSLINVLRSFYVFSTALYNISLSLGILIALTAFAIVYLNHLPETTSFIVKLVAVTLLALLSILGAVGWVLAPLYSAQYQPHFHSQETIRFTPNKSGGYDATKIPYNFENDLGENLNLEEGADRWGEGLDFTFPYYGEIYEKIYISADGAISMGENVRYSFLSYRYGGGVPVIFPLFIDLDTSLETGGIFIREETDRLILTWDHLPSAYFPNTLFTFQVVLYRNGVFEFNYGDLPDELFFEANQEPGASPWIIGAVPARGTQPPENLDFTTQPLEGTRHGFIQDYYLDFRLYLHKLFVPLASLIIGSSLLIIVGLPLLLHLSLVKPLNTLLEGVQQINAGQYDHHINAQHPDEIGFLSQSVNAMSAEMGALIHNLETRVAERTQALQESERTMSTLLSNLPGMAYRCKNDANYTMEFISDGCLDLTGYPPSALIENAEIPYGDLIDPVDRLRIRQEMQPAILARQPFQLRYRIISKGGQERWVWEQGQAILDEQEKVLALEGFIADITEQMQAEEKLELVTRFNEELIQNMNESIVTTDMQGIVTFVNPALPDMLGYTLEEMIGCPWLDFVPPHLHTLSLEQDERRKIGEHSRYEISLLHKDGTQLPVTVGGSPRFDLSSGSFAGTIGVLTDISKLRRTEEKLRVESSNLNERVRGLNCLYSITKLIETPDTSIKEVLEGIVELIPPAWRYPEITCVRISLSGQVYSTKNFKETLWKLSKKINIKGSTIGELTVCYLEEKPKIEDGPFQKEEKALLDLIAEHLRRTIEQMQFEEHLHHTATHDSLTGLPNRALFNDRLLHALSKASRNKEKIAVLFIDLDGFKAVNDTYGHHIGDQLLIAFSKRLQDFFRESDTVARLAGDEFALTLEAISKPLALAEIAKKIISLCSKPYTLENNDVAITLSLGISIYPEDATDADSLLRKADAAMYKAKQQGKDSYLFFNEINS